MIFIIKIIASSLIISFASWLSLKKPQLAGFIIALPLMSIIAIAFSFIEHNDKAKTIVFAKSIMLAVPISLIFFLPFFLSSFLNISFWSIYILSLVLLVVGFFVHRYLSSFF
ncbi:MAG: hypothetical protein CMM91_08815 [Rickettsiales bacterium]|nr:hypothetical protein [Rickettsiales bacterium]OUV53291.1 MAG: hypothetical protein CBC87_04530 [Rickettsiales bacterium TMED127]